MVHVIHMLPSFPSRYAIASFSIKAMNESCTSGSSIWPWKKSPPIKDTLLYILKSKLSIALWRSTKDFIWRSRNCPHHSRKYHAETKTKFHYRPSHPMEHEKRCRLEKKPAVLRYFIHVVRYHHSDIMFIIRRNFTNCYFSAIVSQCCNRR